MLSIDAFFISNLLGDSTNLREGGCQVSGPPRNAATGVNTSRRLVESCGRRHNERYDSTGLFTVT
jgi:hypothetical protein